MLTTNRYNRINFTKDEETSQTFHRCSRLDVSEKDMMVRTTLAKRSKNRRVASSSGNEVLNAEDTDDPTEEDVVFSVETEPRSLTKQTVFEDGKLNSDLKSLSTTKAKNSKMFRKSNADADGVPTAKKTKFHAFPTQKMGNTTSKRIRKPVNKFSPNPETQKLSTQLDPPDQEPEPTAGKVQTKKGKKCKSSIEILVEDNISGDQNTGSWLPQAATVKGKNKKTKYCQSAKPNPRKKTKAVSVKESDEIEPDSDTTIRVTRYTSKLHDSIVEESSTSSYQPAELNIQKDPSFLHNRTNSRKQKDQAFVPDLSEGSTIQVPEPPVKRLPKKRKQTVVQSNAEETSTGSRETGSNVESVDRPSMQPTFNKPKRKKQSIGQGFNAEENLAAGSQDMESNAELEGKSIMPVKQMSKKKKQSNCQNLTDDETLSIRTQEIGSSVPVKSNNVAQRKKKEKKNFSQSPKATGCLQTTVKPQEKANTKCGKPAARSICTNQVPEEQNSAALEDGRNINEYTTNKVPSESIAPLVPEIAHPKKKCGLNKKTAPVKSKWLNPNPPTIIKVKPKKQFFNQATVIDISVKSTNSQSTRSLASTTDEFEDNNNIRKSSTRKSFNNNKVIKVKNKPPPLKKEGKSKRLKSQLTTAPVLDSAKFEKPKPVPISPKTFYNASATDECSGSSLVTVSTSYSWANISSTTSKSSLVAIHGKIPTIIIPRIDERSSPRKCTLTDTTTSTSRTDSSSTSEGSTSDSSKMNSSSSSENYSDLVQFSKLDLSISTDDENEAMYKLNCIECLKVSIKFHESSNFLEKFRVPLSYFIDLKRQSAKLEPEKHVETIRTSNIFNAATLQRNEKHVNTISSCDILTITTLEHKTIPSSNVLNTMTLQDCEKRVKTIPSSNLLNTVTLQDSEKRVKTVPSSNVLNTATLQDSEKRVKTVPSSNVLNTATLQDSEKRVKTVPSSNVLNTATLQESETNVKTISASNMLNAGILQPVNRSGEIKRTFNTFDKSIQNTHRGIVSNAKAGSVLNHNQNEHSTKFDITFTTMTNETASSREDEPGLNQDISTIETSTNTVSGVASSQFNIVSSHTQVKPTGFKNTDNVPVNTPSSIDLLQNILDTELENSDVLSIIAESISSDVSEKRPKGQRQKFICEKQSADSTSLPGSTKLPYPEDNDGHPLPELNSKSVVNGSPSRDDDENNLGDIQPLESSTESGFMFKQKDYKSILFYNICENNLRNQCSYGKKECEYYHIPNKQHITKLKQTLSNSSTWVVINEYLCMRDLLSGLQTFLYYAREFIDYSIRKRFGRTLVEIMLDVRKSVGASSYIDVKSLSALNMGTMKGNCYPFYIYPLEDGRRFVHILLADIAKTTEELAHITVELLDVLVRVKEQVENGTAVSLIKKVCKSHNLKLIKATYEHVIRNTSSKIFSETTLLKNYAIVLLQKTGANDHFKVYYDELLSMVPDLKLSQEDFKVQNGSSASEKVWVPEVTVNGEASPTLHCNMEWTPPFVKYNGNQPRISGPEHNYRISPDTTQHVDLMHMRPYTPRTSVPPLVWNSQLWRQQGPFRWNRAPWKPFQKGPRF